MQNLKHLNVVFTIVILLSACSAGKLQAVPVSPVTGVPQGTDGYQCWNDTIFYEIFVRSFYDSNADGIGDFNGIIQKLDYLNDGDPNTTTDLEVAGKRLMPVFHATSSLGYDVTDYYQVNPDYGTLEDFKRLLDEARKRGIRVIIDMPLNQTSLEHPWFKASQDPNSPYRDWHIWSATDPGYAGPWGETVWHKSPGDIQPTHDWYKNFRQFYKAFDPRAVTVGDEHILIIVNLGNKPLSGYNLSLSLGALSGGYRAVSLFGEETFPALATNAQGGFDAYQPVSTLPVGSPLLIQLQSLK